MKKKLLKFFIIIGALTLLLTTISNAQVQAVTLQSNPNTYTNKGKYTPDNWIIYFREMEKEGGALGLLETIDITTLLSNSGSNNLDSHMVKSTEYGAAAILSASGYGNPKTLQESEIKTTTGNETGVFFDSTYRDGVAAGLSENVFLGVDLRYYDIYGEDNTSAKVGDALGTKDTKNPGCTKWHGIGLASFPTSDHPYLVRNVEAIFGYGKTSSGGAYPSRGVVVCGEGL